MEALVEGAELWETLGLAANLIVGGILLWHLRVCERRDREMRDSFHELDEKLGSAVGELHSKVNCVSKDVSELRGFIKGKDL